ncbi:MAG: hypothetical protein UU82_C0002G0028 [Candidatus Nomurabacteria bacterium GW2011_GWC2_41_8]|uniref:Uncharacterized protein n=1 Tax=Candidatus Nomurabacteria bacterium GW2011_GWC2_41_8 TaxID=1618755 RepID=A0A0G1AHB8_9BACT|nr:MAG: hypothetical protein UU82_C0002G0028 [Candidatus Nomurabacteria bacterium GW2011_GWC2_41_8]
MIHLYVRRVNTIKKPRKKCGGVVVPKVIFTKNHTQEIIASVASLLRPKKI